MAANESIIPTPASPDVVTMEILRNGKTISPQYAILHLLVRKETNRIPTAVIHLDDGEASKSTFAVSNTDEFIPGHAIEIKIGYKGENKTVFGFCFVPALPENVSGNGAFSVALMTFVRLSI